MSFQLVRASDTDIAIWQTEHGHIYVYGLNDAADALVPRLARAAPDSTEPPERFAAEALAFATREAEVRNLIRPVEVERARGTSNRAARSARIG